MLKWEARDSSRQKVSRQRKKNKTEKVSRQRKKQKKFQGNEKKQNRKSFKATEKKTPTHNSSVAETHVWNKGRSNREIRQCRVVRTP
jgi:hypothetical protein